MKIIALALNETTRMLENNSYINTESRSHKDWVLMLLDTQMVIAKSPTGGVYMIPTNAISHMKMDPKDSPECLFAGEPHPGKDNYGNIPGDPGYRGPEAKKSNPKRKSRKKPLSIGDPPNPVTI